SPHAGSGSATPSQSESTPSQVGSSSPGPTSPVQTLQVRSSWQRRTPSLQIPLPRASGSPCQQLSYEPGSHPQSSSTRPSQSSSARLPQVSSAPGKTLSSPSSQSVPAQSGPS